MNLPLFEHDYNTEAKIEPSRVIQPRDVPGACVICFFRNVLEKVITEHQAQIVVENSWEDGSHNLYEINYQDQRVAFFHPGVGAPIAVGLLEEMIAFGCRRFVVVGGSGVLIKDLQVGKLVLVTSAVRDEGTSYHYLPPAREVAVHPAALHAVEQVLKRKHIPYLRAKTWTTDAPYRETQAVIDARRAEGCVTVEMEAASLLAASQFRGVPLSLVLYAGDDLSGEEWDNRGWQSRAEIREALFWLGVEACLELPEMIEKP